MAGGVTLAVELEGRCPSKPPRQRPEAFGNHDMAPGAAARMNAPIRLREPGVTVVPGTKRLRSRMPSILAGWLGGAAPLRSAFPRKSAGAGKLAP
jgi:hypothetical protein